MKDFKKTGGFGGGDRRSGGGGDRPRPSFGGGRPSFGDRRGGASGGGRSFGGGRVEMHKATCANCGKTCEVPFRPNGEKPVYCNDCFGGKSEAPRRDNNFEKRDFADRGAFKPERQENRSSDDLKKTLEGISMKLDKLVALIEGSNRKTTEPTAEKPSLKDMVTIAQKVSKTDKKPSAGKKKAPKKK